MEQESLTPVPDLAATIAELRSVAGQIETWRKSYGLTIDGLLKEYPGMGDAQGGAYSAARRGVMGGRNPMKLLPAYRLVLSELERRAVTLQQDDLYVDLPHVTEFIEHADGLSAQRGMQRLLVVKGASGAGKSSLLRALAQERPGKVLSFTAHVGWRSFYAALGEMLLATGTPERTTTPDNPGLDRLQGYAARTAALTERLLSLRKIVCLDEMQSVSRDFLTWLKDSINAAQASGTALCFVVSAQDALWKKLGREAPEEMRQLLHNRLYLSYEVPPATPEGVLSVITRRLPLTGTDNGKAAMAARLIADASGGKGKSPVGIWAFIRNVCNAIHRTRPESISPAEVVEFAAAVLTDMTGDIARVTPGLRTL